MGEQPIPIRRSQRVYSISGSILFYGMACTIVAAIGLALTMGWLAWTVMRDNDSLYNRMDEYRDAANAARQATSRSRLDLARCEAKLDVVDKWILGGRKIRTP